jgi:hypothetical protein
MDKTKQIQNALRAYGVHLFRDDSGYAPSRAVQALAGRTHYVDPDTMKYFGARINNCQVDFNGLYCWILESVAHPSDGRLHRFVLFDVFGTVLTDRGDMLRKTKRQAEKDKDAFLSSFDPVAHTEKALRDKLAYESMLIASTLEILGAE